MARNGHANSPEPENQQHTGNARGGKVPCKPQQVRAKFGMCGSCRGHGKLFFGFHPVAGSEPVQQMGGNQAETKFEPN